MRTVDDASTNPVPAWDVLLRVFHWALLLFLALAYLAEDTWMSLHSYSGYAVGMLLVFRLTWGVIGSPSARFRGFLYSPSLTIRYLRQLTSGRPPSHSGHNPAGALMIFAFLLSLPVVVFSGMVLYAMEGSGPLAGTPFTALPAPLVAQVHHLSVDLVLVLSGLHIIGVIFTSWRQGENLVLPMISGRKRTHE